MSTTTGLADTRGKGYCADYVISRRFACMEVITMLRSFTTDKLTMTLEFLGYSEHCPDKEMYLMLINEQRIYLACCGEEEAIQTFALNCVYHHQTRPTMYTYEN